VVSVYNDLFFQPALGPLLLMAPHLRRARVGPAALNPYTSHPVEIAGQIALLDRVTDGRAYLGVARGSWLDRLGMTPHKPVEAVRDCVQIVRMLLAGSTEGYRGQVFQLAEGSALQCAPLRPSVPIMIGTWGSHMARMAGELADEVKVGGSANPLVALEMRHPIADGERRAARAPGSVGLCLGAVTVVDEDRHRARELARREMALYAPVVAGLDRSLHGEPWVAGLAEPAVRGDYAAVAALLPDAALDRLAFAGSPRDIIRQVEDLAAAGVSRVEFGTPHGIDALAGIRLLGERVLPWFRA
jgi:5,10-methylenetetrahydromethanopterin reductase